MNLENLKPAKESTKNRKRIGRGEGSGKGGTSTRGHKGAKSRSGYSKKVGFEGGQMPLQRRVPKFGFSNINRVEYKAVNLSIINLLAEKYNSSDITIDMMIESGIVGKNQKVKILNKGQLTKKVNVQAHSFSKTAKESITQSGGESTIAS